MNRYLTVGLTVLAGAALLEVALVPGLVLGGAAVLAPAYLPNLRRRLRPLFDSTVASQPAAAASQVDESGAKLPVVAAPRFVLERLGIKQAIAKTITFRIIVTTLDFTSNYVVIGELTTAAGLTAFGLVFGPLFYLAHETAWNYYGPDGDAVEVSALRPLGADGEATGAQSFTISRALAKTITFRTIATVVDFSASYVATGEVLTAAGLSAFAFVVGPFVYLGHEKVWDYYSSPQPAEVTATPAP
jgi:uncharacterized membrane protein